MKKIREIEPLKISHLSTQDVDGTDRPTVTVFGAEDFVKNMIAAKDNMETMKKLYERMANELKEAAAALRDNAEHATEDCQFIADMDVPENLRFVGSSERRADIQFSHKRKKVTKDLKKAMLAGLTAHMVSQLVEEKRCLVITGDLMSVVMEFIKEECAALGDNFEEVVEYKPRENAQEVVEKIRNKTDGTDKKRLRALHLFEQHIEPEVTLTVRAEKKG